MGGMASEFRVVVVLIRCDGCYGVVVVGGLHLCDFLDDDSLRVLVLCCVLYCCCWFRFV